MNKRRKTQSLTKEDRQKLVEHISKRKPDEKSDQQPDSARKEEQKKEGRTDLKKGRSKGD